MVEARAATGLKTKREVVELGLRTLVRLKRQTEIRNDRGKLPLAASLVGADPQP